MQIPYERESIRRPLTVGDPDLQHLVVLFGMSVRAFNVCESAGLHRLSDIRDFAVRHGGFGKLRNCGHKTQLELEDILKRSAGAGCEQMPSEEAPSLEVVVDPQRMQQVFTAHFLRLSTRSRNVLLHHAGSTEPEVVLRFFMNQGRKMPKLPGAGTTVMYELRTMREGLLNGLAQHAIVDASATQQPSEEQLWAERHEVDPGMLSLLKTGQDSPTVLRFFDGYLTENWHGRHVFIYLMYLKQSDGPVTLESIGKSMGLTRERVRQILKKLEAELPPLLVLAADLPGVTERYPELTTDGPWLMVPPELVAHYNAREGTMWSPLFLAYLAFVLNDRRLSLVKWTEFFDGADASRTLDREQPLLMEEAFAVQLRKTMARVVEIQERKRRTDEQIPLASILQDGEHTDVMREALRRMVIQRYPEVGIVGDDLLFKPNAKRNQEVLLEEVLSALNEPSHVSRILEEWTQRFPSVAITESGIRSVAIRQKDVFFSIGRTSTYGLRRWELERPEVKGGTIRDIIEELLQPSDTPLHVDELMEEVRRYRPSTNAESLWVNLQLEASGRFVLLPGGFVGLSAKHYDRIPDPPARVPGSLMRSSVLTGFIGKYRSALAQFLAERCEADPQRINRVINAAIEEGRLKLDAQGLILSAVAIPDEIEPNEGELPFDW